MDNEAHNVLVTDPFNSKSVRRFWMAWLLLLLAMLGGLIVIILIASVVADPARISPAG
jgi:hypothetical protein